MHFDSYRIAWQSLALDSDDLDVLLPAFRNRRAAAMVNNSDREFTIRRIAASCNCSELHLRTREMPPGRCHFADVNITPQHRSMHTQNMNSNPFKAILHRHRFA